MSQLPRPVLNSKRGTSVSSRKPKGGNAAASVVSEELQVQQETVAAEPAAQNLLPPTLLFVAVGECDVDMLKREVILRQLLETKDNGVIGRIPCPRSFLDKRSTDL